MVAVVAGLCGGPGVCPGANIGKNVAIFEQVTCWQEAVMLEASLRKTLTSQSGSTDPLKISFSTPCSVHSS